MQQPRANTFDAREVLRSLPVLLAALLAVVGAVDLLLLLQPALLDRWSHAFRSALSLRPVLAPATHVLAATLAVSSVVLSSAAAIFVARAVRAAPHVTIAPAWVSLCLLSAARLERPLPLPIPTPVFIVLSAILFIGGSTLLRSGSRAFGVFGWALIAAPLVSFGLPYAMAPGAHAFGAESWRLMAALLLSASGAIGSAYVRVASRGPREVKGLEGVDVVDELFAQVERAERSEARVAELERKLGQYERPQAARPVRPVR
jgi:hypothetical protein